MSLPSNVSSGGCSRACPTPACTAAEHRGCDMHGRESGPRVTLGLATLSTQSCSTGAAPPGFSFLCFQAQNSSPGLARRDPTGSNLPQSTRMCVNTSQRWFCSCLLLDPAQQTFGMQQLHLQHGPTLWCRALKYSPGGWERRGLTGRGDLDGMGGSIGKGLSVRGRS